MYVALVYPYDLSRPGGVRSHVAGLGEELVRRGHRVEVIAPSAHERLQSLVVTSCGRSNPVAFGGTQIDITWAPWRRVMAVARRGYDVMHFHTIWNPLMPFQLAAAYRGARVATFHDVAGPSTPGWAAALMPPGSEVVRRLLLDKVIAVSPVVSQHLTNGHEVIPNGIAVPPLPPEGEREALLYVGRLEPRKGVRTLIEAVARLGAQAPPLWIAGDGPLRAELQELVAARRLANVTFFGDVDEPRKWSLLRRAALVVAPSVGGESFGIVLLEAMAAGAPPLGADNAGYRHVLRERPELLFPVHDAEALARSIRALMADRPRRDALRQWGETFHRQFAWSVVAERVEGVYRGVLRAG